MASLFFSYSHKDEELRNQLETHLIMLKRHGFIETWHDRRIIAGEEVHKEISQHLEAADVVLLLVSSDFLASDYCYEIEMQRAMERHEAKEATVIPVIIRPCDWHGALFGKLMAAPTDGKPITKWANMDEAFLDVVQAIKAALKKKGSSGMSSPFPQTGKLTSSTPKASDIRSSNLGIPKQFTESEQDTFLHDTFTYIATFFENSLSELSERNSGIEGRFRQLDANRFTSVIYRNGEAVARCTVFLGGYGGRANQIGYASNDSGATNSYNESLSVETDGQLLFLKAFGMSSMFQQDKDAKLSQEGAAELLWGILLSPLQATRY